MTSDYQPTIAPVLVLAWIRQEKILSLLQVLRVIKPPRLYLSQDGPREGQQNDISAITNIQRLFHDNIDWDCTFIKHMHPTNLGCGLGVAAGIDWFFLHENEGIILEDDIVPEPTFFTYATILLDKYRLDDRIGAINGSNLSFGYTNTPTSSSYFFSKYPYVFWGWATWKHTWQSYQKSYDFYANDEISHLLKCVNLCPSFIKRWSSEVEAAFDTHHTWDFLWMFTLWSQNMLVCIPDRPLVKNIGYDIHATHTTQGQSLQTTSFPMTLPLRHPHSYLPDYSHDKLMLSMHLDVGFLSRLRYSIISRCLKAMQSFSGIKLSFPKLLKFFANN